MAGTFHTYFSFAHPTPRPPGFPEKLKYKRSTIFPLSPTYLKIILLKYGSHSFYYFHSPTGFRICLECSTSSQPENFERPSTLSDKPLHSLQEDVCLLVCFFLNRQRCRRTVLLFLPKVHRFTHQRAKHFCFAQFPTT